MSARTRFPSLPSGAARVFEVVVDTAKPPPKMTVSEWADERRVFGEGQGGTRTGQKWRTDYMPQLREVMDVCGVDYPCRSVAIGASAQSAKTECIVNAIGHMIDLAPRPAGAMLPSLDTARKFVDDKLEPMFEASPCFKDKVAAQRKRSEKGSTSMRKRFRGGKLTMLTSGASANLQSLTLGMVVGDEVVEFEDEAGERGDPIDQLLARTIAWGDEAKALWASTFGVKGRCKITKLIEAGTLRRYYVPCPHCGEHQVLRFANMDLSGVRVTFTCPAHGCVIEQHHLPEMLAGGHWISCYRSPDPDWEPIEGEEPPENPANPRPPDHFPPEDLAQWRARPSEGRDPSYWWWRAYSRLGPWTDIRDDWRKAQGRPEKLKAFFQQTLAEAYEESYDVPEAERLQKAWAEHGAPRGVIPDYCCFITAQLDVQGDRLEWAVYAHGPHARSACIDDGVFIGDPAGDQVWTELRNWLRTTTYEGPHTIPLTFDLTVLDAGWMSQHVYAFCANHPGVMAIKGDANPTLPPVGTPTRKRAIVNGTYRGTASLWPAGVYSLRKEHLFGLSAGLTAAESKSGELPYGATAFHREVSVEFCEQLTGNVLDPRKTFKGQPVFVKRRDRDEQFDLGTYGRYARAARRLDSLTEEQWRAEFAARAKDPCADAAVPFDRIWLGGAPGAGEGGASPPASAPREPEPAPPIPTPNPRPGADKPSWLDRLADVSRN